MWFYLCIFIFMFVYLLSRKTQTSTDLQLQKRRALHPILESVLRSAPVEDLPDALHIRGLVIEVLKRSQPTTPKPQITTKTKKRTHLQIISMFPHIHPKNRHLIRNRILILRRNNLQLAPRSISHQPTPSTPLQPQKRSPKRLLELLDRPVLGLDGRLQDGGGLVDVRLGGGVGGQVLPEEGVVDVATAVELDLLLEVDELGDVVCGESGGLGGEGGVEVGDIGLVVFLVVDFHDLFADDGF